MAEVKGKIRTREELEEKIKEIFGIDTISLLIKKQITTYVVEHEYTYLEIARALFYFYVVNEGDLSKARGIGIVPYVMADARKYFKDLVQREQQQAMEIRQMQESQQTVIVCNSVDKKRRKQRSIQIENIKEVNNG